MAVLGKNDSSLQVDLRVYKISDKLDELLQ